jgi:hypothetical protein
MAFSPFWLWLLTRRRGALCETALGAPAALFSLALAQRLGDVPIAATNDGEKA